MRQEISPKVVIVILALLVLVLAVGGVWMWRSPASSGVSSDDPRLHMTLEQRRAFSRDAARGRPPDFPGGRGAAGAGQPGGGSQATGR